VILFLFIVLIVSISHFLGVLGALGGSVVVLIFFAPLRLCGQSMVLLASWRLGG
jgi:hypothetical protein